MKAYRYAGNLFTETSHHGREATGSGPALGKGAGDLPSADFTIWCLQGSGSGSFRCSAWSRNVLAAATNSRACSMLTFTSSPVINGTA